VTRRETKSYPIAGLKSIDTETGAFEAIVSVFGNVDLHGHRIDSHAFDASIDRWKASGDPIPVIFSHQWDDLAAYLGTIDPSGLEALQPGDAGLPEEIREFGGLKVAGQLDTTEPEGRKAAKLLKSRAVREFSFAYDVFDEAKGDDGHLDLLELDLIEVGPTLKGANPLTQLVSAKSDRLTLEEVAGIYGLKAAELAEAIAALDAIEAGGDPYGEKATVQLAGTIEALQGELTRQAQAWAGDEYGQNLYAVALEGTFTDRAVFYVELWDDPVGGGRYFEAEYSVEGDTVELGELTPVDIVAETRPKAAPRRGAKEGRRNATADAARLQSIHDLTRELGAECETADEEPEGEADDDDETGTESRSAAAIRTSLDIELLEL
jgi:HK97 family phage prohead protease